MESTWVLATCTCTQQKDARFCHGSGPGDLHPHPSISMSRERGHRSDGTTRAIMRVVLSLSHPLMEAMGQFPKRRVRF